MTNLASIAVNLCAPHRVVCIGRDRGGLLPQLARIGVEELHQVAWPNATEIVSHASQMVKTQSFDFDDVYRPTSRFDLCVFLDDAEICDDKSLGHIIDSCVACSDTILFGSTPPGEIGVAWPGVRPLAWWVRQFWKRGYRFHDVVRPLLEPLRFAYSSSPIYEVTSSELANLYLIGRGPGNGLNDHAQWEQWLVEKDSRIEDMGLQAIFSDILVQNLLKQLKAAQDLVASQNARLGEYAQMNEQGEMRGEQIEATLQYEQALAVKDARLRQIEQSLEYRLSIRLGRYPRLLRVLACAWRALSPR